MNSNINTARLQKAYTKKIHKPFLNSKPGEIIGHPFMKWAGGKKSLLAQIIPHLPRKFNCYYEPFLGGGALFFALQPKGAVLTDVNQNLINVYVEVRDNVEKIISSLKELPYNKEIYYEIRDYKPSDPTLQAIRMLYLNRTCWNGLYRENLKGEFNVPFGDFKNPTICDENALRRASEALKNTLIRSTDFEESLSYVREGDFVFLDPPYTVLNESDRFTKYNSNIFSWEDQKRLAKTAVELANKGAFVVVTNAHNKEIKQLYTGFRRRILRRSSTISGKSKGRKKTTEYLLLGSN
ncbi:DNA adenine methylase [Paenibacillus senegalensis]|uniref:DNA adenine methylase n=1 Tax=Paenibacillus senegalensis TaxID=1465766 RepID=UPI000288B61E|nr:DNA adenine methylase [Paenibacillus senegalensis]